jgi:3-oxoacyl-[acyl-carrier protein] reductase
MKKFLVTGASKGIGKAIALQLAEANVFISVHCVGDLAGAEQTLSEVRQRGGDGEVLQFDIADRARCREVLAKSLESGAFWGVVCNAGITRDTAFPAMTDEEWDSVIHTNLDGFYNVVQPLVMPMIRMRSGGRIVAISSVSGVAGNRGQVNYSASKAGLIGATKALALELAKRKITVNCVAPGLIDTGMVSEEVRKHAMDLIPLRRMGNADEVAATVKFLVSDGAAYITRQTISVNGGMV